VVVAGAEEGPLDHEAGRGGVVGVEVLAEGGARVGGQEPLVDVGEEDPPEGWVRLSRRDRLGVIATMLTASEGGGCGEDWRGCEAGTNPHGHTSSPHAHARTHTHTQTHIHTHAHTHTHTHTHADSYTHTHTHIHTHTPEAELEVPLAHLGEALVVAPVLDVVAAGLGVALRGGLCVWWLRPCASRTHAHSIFTRGRGPRSYDAAPTGWQAKPYVPPGIKHAWVGVWVWGGG
jgi:hypothetical protein